MELTFTSPGAKVGSFFISSWGLARKLFVFRCSCCPEVQQISLWNVQHVFLGLGLIFYPNIVPEKIQIVEESFSWTCQLFSNHEMWQESRRTPIFGQIESTVGLYATWAFAVDHRTYHTLLIVFSPRASGWGRGLIRPRSKFLGISEKLASRRNAIQDICTKCNSTPFWPSFKPVCQVIEGKIISKFLREQAVFLAALDLGITIWAGLASIVGSWLHRTCVNRIWPLKHMPWVGDLMWPLQPHANMPARIMRTWHSVRSDASHEMSRTTWVILWCLSLSRSHKVITCGSSIWYNEVNYR